MKFCPNCGKELVNTAVNFCPNCGYDLRTVNDVTLQPTTTNKEPSASQKTSNVVSTSKEATVYSDEVMATSEIVKNSKVDYSRALVRQLDALYSVLIAVFQVPSSNASLATRFSRIKLRLLRKIKGYDLDEISSRVEPLMADEHVATLDDITFVKDLIKKYQNYFRESKLEKVIDQLSGQASNAIVDAENLSNLQNYMHISRGMIEEDFLSILSELNTQHGKLVLLIGNVGDGKSHLIGYLKDKHPAIFKQNNIHIHYDATESFDPKETAMDTLFRVLSPFSDERANDNQQNLIVAINMGVLVNFIRAAEKAGGFTQLIEYIQQTSVLDNTNRVNKVPNNNYTVLSFRNYPVFVADETGSNSPFYDQLFDKVAQKTSANPFYSAYVDDQEHFVQTITSHNYQLFLHESVRDRLKYLLIKIQVQSKVIISTRALLEFLHDILMPTKLKEDNLLNYEAALPFLLFDGAGDSLVIKKINQFDPALIQNQQVEKLNSKIFNTNRDLSEVSIEILGERNAGHVKWLWNYVEDANLNIPDETRLFIRIKYLLESQNSLFSDLVYRDYLSILAAITNDDIGEKNVRLFERKLMEFLFQWNGSPQKNYLFTFVNQAEKFGVAIPMNLRFKEIKRDGFNLVVKIENIDSRQDYELVIDYDLYSLVNRVNQGYLLKNEDRQQFVNVSSFIENISKSDKGNQETIIGNIQTGEYYRLTYDGIEVSIGENN